MIPVPTTGHNQALSGDTLYSAFLNYQWRQIVLPFIVSGMEQIASGIEDEIDRQEFEVLYGAMIDDFYNEDIVDNTPIGIINPFIGEIADIPAKWLLLDGSTKNNADYPELAAIMPPLFDGTTQFVLPDLRLRMVRGADIDSAVGASGGSDTTTLTVADLPAHHHIVPAHAHTVGTRPAAGNNTGSVSLGSLAANGTIATDTEPATDTSDTGSGTAFNNIPRVLHFHWIIKALP